MDEQPTEWTRVAAAADIPNGGSAAVRLGTQSLLLVRIGDAVYATGNRCTHQGAPLSKGKVATSITPPTVTCPIHGSIFRLTDGAVVRGPASAPIPAFEARLDGDEIHVRARPG